MAKVAWVTGAGRGIGRNLALDLTKIGWNVAVTSRTSKDLQSLESEARSLSGKIKIYSGDIREARLMRELLLKIETDMGPVELAILNAGTYIRFGIEEFSVEKFNRQIDINLIGTVNCLAPMIKSMRKQKKGHIVIVSSLSAYKCSN